MKGLRGMIRKKRGPRRTMPAGEPVQINKQVITPGELDDGGKLYPARGLPGGSGILPEEERPDVPELVLTELGLTVRKQIRADAEKLFFFARLPKALGEKLTSLSKEIAADVGVEPEEADHVTVLYLKSSKGAISEELAGDVVRAAQKALGAVSPLEATLQGWGYFDGAKKNGKEHTALVALLDCPGLAEAHVALKGAMEGLGLPVEAQTHGYVPHATVAYLDGGDRVDNLPTLGDKFRIGELELMHTEGHVLELGGTVEKNKALKLAPDTDVSGASNKELLQVHWQLHMLFRDEKTRAAAKFSTEDVSNLHALVVDELFDRDRKHPAPPDEGLDDVSADFERHVEEQPDWTEVPEKRGAKRDYAPINTSGVERGDEITLGEVLPYFKTFKTKKPYVYLVGGLANRGATKGDIDILVKDTEELPDDFRHVLHFRLGRMLPPELAERLEIHYDNFHGPFTRFVELYDLTFERINPENEVKLMREGMVVVEKIGPFKRWGGSARYATRLASNLPVHKRYVEPFAGAASLLFAKEPAEEEILSDLDGEIAHAFKMIKGADEDLIKSLEKKDRVVSEAKFREFAKSIPSGSIDRLHRFLYVQGASYSGSRNGPPPTDRIGKVAYDPSRLVRFRDRLKNVKIVHEDYREMLKKYDDEETLFFLDPPYPGEWAKDKDDIGDERSKAELDLDEFVDLVKKLKGKWVVVLGDSEEQKKAIKETGGKTFSYELAKSTGRGTKMARRYFATNAEKLSKQAPRAAPAERVEKADPYMEIPPEEKAPYRYTVQNHFRGESVHSDLRIAFRPGKLLIGWTLLTGIKDAVKTPVVTLAAARQLGRVRMGEISKIDWGTGEWAKRPKRGAKEPVRVSVQATRKAPEPHAWLDVEGKTKDPVEGKPPPVGGTRHFPGVFQVVDRGDIEFGATKPWLHEYFPSGRALNYRLFFRQLKLKADGTAEELPDNLQGEVLEKVILPPSEEAELPGPIWLCIRPDDQTPYVLDVDAVKKGWMPPLGVSALPKAIREQVSAEHRYWEQKTGAKAKEGRDALHAAVKAKEVEIDFEAPYKRRTAKASMPDARFVLQEQTWRGPIQIRVGPSETLWHLRLDVGRPELIVVEMYLNPLDNDKLAVRVADDPHKESMGFEGDIKPSHYLNPTKATPSRIEILDNGEASVLAASDKFLKVQIKGERFKGLFEAKRSDGDWLWAPSRVTPKTKSGDEEQQISYEVPILKVDDAKREITGIVLEPEEWDAQDEIVDDEIIAKAAHRFLARFNRETTMGLMHKMFGQIGVELYESWTTKVEMVLGGEKIKKGSWLMTVHVLSDSVWKKVQNGEITGFSIGGTAAMV